MGVRKFSWRSSPQAEAVAGRGGWGKLRRICGRWFWDEPLLVCRGGGNHMGRSSVRRLRLWSHRGGDGAQAKMVAGSEGPG